MLRLGVPLVLFVFVAFGVLTDGRRDREDHPQGHKRKCPPPPPCECNGTITVVEVTTVLPTPSGITADTRSNELEGPSRDSSEERDGHNHQGHGHDHQGHEHDHQGHGHDNHGQGHDHQGHGHNHQGHGHDHDHGRGHRRCPPPPPCVCPDESSQ